MESLPKPTYKFNLKGRYDKLYFRPNPQNNLFVNQNWFFMYFILNFMMEEDLISDYKVFLKKKYTEYV